ncbi:MoxR family ATPase [Neobacillus sp. YX16]|uniref:AAA family ATPase n=1 Tax=Neobacillus sp. YX16 TaxID=3047874 RepID=UPI0024C466E0|nr:MoxR family ATPase [Neobacillus sp. YX16]WHZ00718.1 MoxR family ATPase [Neobacillus sp. YX16]
MEHINRVKSEISKVMVGMDREVELLTISLLFNGHILLESVPGTGKTMLAKSFASSIDGIFSRIQFTPDVLPSDVTGIQFFNPKIQEFELRTGPIVANIVLADEINRATPRTQSSLLEVMEERQVTIDGVTVKVDDPFMVIATQNPVEAQQGTFSLPVAQMDRFFMKLTMNYPSLESEKEILKQARGIGNGHQTNAVLSHVEINKLKEFVQHIKINDTVESYLLQIVRKTRQHPEIDLGVSPRGALALMKAAQGQAFLENREYVIPEDIKKMVPYVLGHRIILSTEASFTKSDESVLKEVLESVPVPVEMGS